MCFRMGRFVIWIYECLRPMPSNGRIRFYTSTACGSCPLLAYFRSVCSTWIASSKFSPLLSAGAASVGVAGGLIEAAEVTFIVEAAAVATMVEGRITFARMDFRVASTVAPTLAAIAHDSTRMHPVSIGNNWREIAASTAVDATQNTDLSGTSTKEQHSRSTKLSL